MRTYILQRFRLKWFYCASYVAYTPRAMSYDVETYHSVDIRARGLFLGIITMPTKAVKITTIAVSYTHLKLPTIYSV